MRRTLLRVAVCCWAATAGVGAVAQSLTPEILKQLESARPLTPSDRALRNAMSRTDLRTLAGNIDALSSPDTDFSDRVPTKGITDQASSGRCWLFSGLNVLRATAIARHGLPALELSQVYLFFYDQLEKSNLFLQGIIDTRDRPMDDRMVDWLFSNPLSDGGTFCGVADLVMKYGVVPKEAMPETYSSNNTAQIDAQLKLKLREYALDLRRRAEKGASARELQSAKLEALVTVYHILSLAYGTPPTQFQWSRRDRDGHIVSQQTFTPRGFYERLWGDDLRENYVMMMDDPCRPYYKLYTIDFDRHTYDGADWCYLNLPASEIKPLAIASIRDSTAMYFSCDVGKCYDRKNGTLDLRNYNYEDLLGTTFGMNKRDRVLTHASGSTHAMTLIAVDVDSVSDSPRKWLLENSWGASSGWQGKLIMTDEWFDEYMFRLVVGKKYVPQRYLNMLRQKPIQLPAWDPMFAEED